MIHPGVLPAAAQAFDAVADGFDDRYGAWQSVAAQRRAVRAALLAAFRPGARVLEIGGGTGEDAVWLARHSRQVYLTDASPSMVRIAQGKLRDHPGSHAAIVPAEALEELSRERNATREPLFDGAFSNFAALNCVTDLGAVGRGLAQLVTPGAPALLVTFGPMPPGEVVVQLARGDLRAAFRRLAAGPVPARLGERQFTVRYHRPAEVRRAMAPWFRLTARYGIGVLVPPSAAEPWISRQPRLLRLLERADTVLSRPLALLGDHVLYRFERTGHAVGE
jgi:SAM-dependent methyltransferase